MIDLGGIYEVTGLRYLARQDGGWNGAIAKCEFSVMNTQDEESPQVFNLEFKKSRKNQEQLIKPISGRFVRIAPVSEVTGNSFASAAEFGIIGKPRK